VPAAGGGLFLYLLIWSLAVCQRQGGLQPLATGGLLLSCGVLGKPATAISCLVLTVIYFLIRGRRGTGGARNFALLLFTPALLCGLALVMLQWLARTDSASWAAWLSTLSLSRTVLPAADPAPRTALPASLAFAFAVLAARLGERKAGAIDAAYAAVLAFLGFAGSAAWMPVPLNAADLALVTAGGALSLAATHPPAGWPGRAIVLVGALSPLAFGLA
jgi:hypothetical protein